MLLVMSATNLSVAIIVSAGGAVLDHWAVSEMPECRVNDLRENAIELGGRQEIGMGRDDSERDQVAPLSLFSHSKDELADL